MPEKRVLPTSERARKRYAEDADYRRRRLAANRAYFAANRASINARRRRQLADAAFRNEQRVRRYGMSWDDYELLSARQGGACAICGREPSQALCVDHCHSTGRVRGLLCHHCNWGLGFFEDAPDRLQAAAEYVEVFAGDAPR